VAGYDTPTGRQPKKQIALRPSLALAFRHIAKKERRQLSDLFQEMFSLWLQRKRRGKYPEVQLDDEEEDYEE